MNEMKASGAVPYLTSSCAVRVTRDVVYGEAGVDFVAGQGAARHRAMKLDVYAPDDASAAAPRPALILAFGGAFHRGTKESDEFPDEHGASSTPVSGYANLFAARGYVCFCIDYRLTQELPDPGVTPILRPDEPMNKDRVNEVRAMLGLPPATDRELANGIEAATDDVVRAISFVRSRARFYNVDVARIAVGGFSAGAMIALNAAFVERAPVAAVVSLSGRMTPHTLAHCVAGTADEPAVLMFVGEHDLPVIRDGSDATEARLHQLDPRHRVVRLPGASHFYPKGTRATDGRDVETTIAQFLFEALHLGTRAAS